MNARFRCLEVRMLASMLLPLNNLKSTPHPFNSSFLNFGLASFFSAWLYGSEALSYILNVLLSMMMMMISKIKENSIRG